jgi:hypothetical protein
MLVSGAWVWLMMIASSAGFSMLVTTFIEGWSKGKVKFNGSTNPPAGGLAILAGALGMFGFMLYAMVTNYPKHVPVSDLFSVGMLYPALGLLAIPAAVAAVYGMSKGLFRIGTGVRAIARGLRNLFDGIRGISAEGEEERAAQRQCARHIRQAPRISAEGEDERAAQQPQAVAGIEQARRKFADVDNLCYSLRAILGEGTAFDQLGEISTELARVRSAIEEDSNKQSALGTLLSDYLVPTEQALRLYERLLKRNVGSAQESLREMGEKTLPLMRDKITALYDQIHVADIAQLATVASSFQVARTLEVKLEAEAEVRV